MMTNAEKFAEVFGFDHNEERCPFPSVVCEDRVACDDCPLADFWEKKYRSCFKLRPDFGKGAE